MKKAVYEKKGGLRLVPLALPILMEQILRSLLGTVNTFMISRISDEASAAVGVANQVLNVVIIAATMLASGTAVLVNQNLGAGKEREASRITMNSLTVSAGVGLALSAITMAFAQKFVRLLGLEDSLVGDAAGYLRIVGISCVFQFISTMIATHFRCRGKAHLPMIVIVFNNVVNLAGSYLVVNHLLPLEGVSGIASVRLLSEAFGLALIIVLMARQKWQLHLQELWQIEKEHLRQIIRIGFMSGAEGISFTLAQLVTTSFITGLPSTVLSAKVYVQTVNNYTYMAGLAVGQAAQIISGHKIGAGDTEGAYRFIKKSWLYVLGCNTLFSVAFYLFSSRIIGIFTSAQEIKTIAHTLFLIDIFTCMGRSLNHSYNYGLRSAGYVFWPMIFANLSIWIVSVGFGYVMTCAAGLGIVGLWIAAATDEWLRGLFAAQLWLRRRWEGSVLVKQGAEAVERG